jgi:hypothetical protein
MRTTSSGTDAMMSEARPVGTVRSATKRRPFAPGSSSPISAAEASSRRPTRNAPRPRRHATHAAISEPAIRNREDTATNDGIVSPATLMPRYVEPQSK